MGDQIETEKYTPRGMNAINVSKKQIFWKNPQSLSEEERKRWAELGHC